MRTKKEMSDTMTLISHSHNHIVLVKTQKTIVSSMYTNHPKNNSQLHAPCTQTTPKTKMISHKSANHHAQLHVHKPAKKKQNDIKSSN